MATTYERWKFGAAMVLMFSGGIVGLACSSGGSPAPAGDAGTTNVTQGPGGGSGSGGRSGGSGGKSGDAGAPSTTPSGKDAAAPPPAKGDAEAPGGGESQGGGGSKGGNGTPCGASAVCKKSEVCDTVSGTCVECLTSATCGGQKCDVTTHSCVDCLVASDCVAMPGAGAGGMPMTCVAGTCTATCTQSSDCPASTPVCQATTHACVECATSADCAANQVCQTDFTCE